MKEKGFHLSRKVFPGAYNSLQRECLPPHPCATQEGYLRKRLRPRRLSPTTPEPSSSSRPGSGMKRSTKIADAPTLSLDPSGRFVCALDRRDELQHAADLGRRARGRGRGVRPALLHDSAKGCATASRRDLIDHRGGLDRPRSVLQRHADAAIAAERHQPAEPDALEAGAGHAVHGGGRGEGQRRGSACTPC